MAIILDLETDGLYNECNKIHCAVAYDPDLDIFTEFTPDEIHKLPRWLDHVTALSCHNGIGFDLKVLKKVLNYDYKGKYIDTLLLSRILWPDLEPASYRDESTGKTITSKSTHGVEGWGIRLGISKPVHEDWKVFSPEMLHRCKEDVKIQAKLFQHIQQKMDEYNINWVNVINCEQKVWRIMEEAADYGWDFDLQKAYELVEQLSTKVQEIDTKLVSLLPLKTIQVTKTESGSTKAFKANGDPTESTIKWWLSEKPDVPLEINGDFCKVQFEQFNIGSSQQVKNYLLTNGWKPKEWNFKKDRFNKPIRDKYNNLIKASPKVPKTAEDWEEVAEQIQLPSISLLSERNKASHRCSQIKGLIAATRMDHRIEAQANTCATNTARMTHRTVVNIPKADPKVYYGQQMRSLFRASEGKVLVGCDASALEARIEAHYIYPYDRITADELINGDIHSKNAEVFQTTRSIAKNGKYAILYGCSPNKLATTINKPVSFAKEIYESYWAVNPALKQLKEDLEAEYNEKGYLLAIDGRPLTIRYKHAIINTLFQSAGAIAVKLAMCYQSRCFKNLGLDVHLLGVFHDEMQFECSPDIAEQVGTIAIEGLRQAGKHLKLNIELDGEYKIGSTWEKTH